MGVQFSLVTCGRCGQARGLTHTCVSSRRKRRTAIRPKVTITCRTCGKPRGLNHTCAIRTDFAKRKAAAERKAKAARKAQKKRERRQAATARRRKAAAKRRAAARARKASAKAARPKRPRPPAHDYRTCTDPTCEKYGCLAYRQGTEDCPRPHKENGG
jgi:hypothetical protein